MPEGNVFKGFGTVKIRDDFLLPVGDGRFLRAIKVTTDSAIIDGQNISYNLKVKPSKLIVPSKN